MSTLPSTAGAFGRGPERRRNPRCRVIEKQLVTVDLGPQQRGLLVDVSVSGAAVQPYSAMTHGQASLVKFEVPGEQLPFEAEGVVTWVGPSGRVGLRFEKINDVAEQALKDWIAMMMAPAPAAMNHAAYSTAAYLPPSYSPWIKMSDVAVEHSPLDDEIGSLDLVSALRLVVERARSLTHATGAAVALADRTDMVCRARTGIAPDLGARFSPDTGLSGEVVRTGMVVRCPDTSQDPRVDRVACERLNIRSIVIVPILSGRAVIGVIEVFSARFGAFDERHVLNLTRLADLVSAMLEAGMEGISSGGVAAADPASWIGQPDVVPALESSGEGERSDPLEDLDGAIETECLLQTRAASGLGITSDNAAADPQPADRRSLCATEEHEVEPTPRTPEEITDIFNRLRLANEAADKRWRNRIILSIVCVVGFGTAGLYVTRAMMRPSTPHKLVAASPIVSKSEAAAEIPPATVEIPSIPEATDKKPAAGSSKVAVPSKSSKPSTLSERWSWSAPTAPGTGSDLTLESAAVAPVVTDTIMASRGDVTVISDMLGSWPASSPNLTAPEPQIKTVVPGKLVSRVNPIFPPMASASALHGRVELKVAIDKEGAVTKVEQVSGNAILGSAAAQAVRKWRYEPSQLDGRPVAVEKTIIIDFADPRKK